MLGGGRSMIGVQIIEELMLIIMVLISETIYYTDYFGA